eukprot:8005477-Lingulodinium_polyedra.AAC.1
MAWLRRGGNSFRRAVPKVPSGPLPICTGGGRSAGLVERRAMQARSAGSRATKKVVGFGATLPRSPWKK